MPRERENKQPSLSLWFGSEFLKGVLICWHSRSEELFRRWDLWRGSSWVYSSRQNWDPQHPSSVPSHHDMQLPHKGRNTETRNLKVSGTVSHKKSSPCLRCFSLASAPPTESLTHHLGGYNWEVGCGETAGWSEHWPPFYRTGVWFPASSSPPSVTPVPGASTPSTGLLGHFIHVVHRHTCNLHTTCMHLYA